MEQNEKPYQFLAWTATAILILAAILASFVPALEYHHWAFILANSLWVIVGFLWREMTLIVLNAGLTIIYNFEIKINVKNQAAEDIFFNSPFVIFNTT